MGGLACTLGIPRARAPERGPSCAKGLQSLTRQGSETTPRPGQPGHDCPRRQVAHSWIAFRHVAFRLLTAKPTKPRDHVLPARGRRLPPHGEARAVRFLCCIDQSCKCRSISVSVVADSQCGRWLSPVVLGSIPRRVRSSASNASRVVN